MARMSGVILPGAQQVDGVHVGLVAEGEEHVVADADLRRPVEDGVRQRAGLRKQPQVSVFRRHRGEGGIQADVGGDNAQTVGADNAYAVPFGRFHQCVLQLRAVGTDFFEAGGNDDHGIGAFLPALLDRADHEFRRDDDDGQVDGTRDIQHGLVCFQSLDFIGFRIHRIDVALEFGVDQVMHDVVTDFAGFSGGADDGNRFGSEKVF